MTPTDPHEKLERAIHQTLRQMPPRRAPSSLEQRVLAEIERRAALPWWRKSFAYWPLPARGAFIVLSAAVVKLAIMALVWAMAGFDTAQYREAFSTQFAWMQSGLMLWQTLTSSFEAVLRAIPPLWLYGGLAFVATMYVALFGLGAAAYRTLYATR